MNKLFLYLVMLPSALWRSMGADIPQLRALLQTRLMIDDRKPMSLGMRQTKQKKDRKHGSVLNSFIFLIMGAVYMFPIISISDRIFSLTLYFSFLLVVMTFMLITDFSNVLFDAKDKYILFPRPINDRTLVLARMLHVYIYLLRIMLPMSLPAWIVLGVFDGWKSALLFPLPLILVIFMALFIVNSVYLLVLRLTKPEKFKDVINYFQVVTSIIFFASVYLLPRIFKNGERVDISILSYPWIKYLPSYWLASCWSWIGFPLSLVGTSYFSLLAIAFPLLCIYIVVNRLAPEFSRRIAGIDAVDVVMNNPLPGSKQRAPATFYKKMANLFNRTEDGKAGFMIAWLQTSRSRSFRMRVYPAFAFIPIYFIYLLTSGNRSFNYALTHLADGNKFLLLLYMTSFAMVSALTYLTMSDQYKAAWVYYATPLAAPGRVMAGALKAIWVKYFLPFFIITSIFVIYIWGAARIPDVLLALVNVTLVVTCIARISFRHLPFSVMEQMKQGGARFMKSFLVMIIPATLGIGHFFALPMLWLKIIFLILSSILLWLALDSYAETSWDNMIKTQSE